MLLKSRYRNCKKSKQIKLNANNAETNVFYTYSDNLCIRTAACMGLGLPELTFLVNTITELVIENGISESMAVNKFMDDVTEHYKFVSGFETKLEELKNETEDTAVGLIILRQSGSELDEVTDSLRKLWAMGVKTEDIIDLANVLGKEITNNIDHDNIKKIDLNEALPSDLKKYRNLETHYQKFE